MSNRSFRHILLVFSSLWLLFHSSLALAQDQQQQQQQQQPQATITITASANNPIPTTFTDSNLFEASILNSTNTYRYQHGAPALVWNSSLAIAAKSWSNHCHFAHSHTPSLGENIATGFQNVTAAVDAWGDERALYKYSDPCFNETTGHFSQLVWKETTSTGCAVTNCGTGGTGSNAAMGWLLVCEYYPAGNVVGPKGQEDVYFQQNVGPQVKQGQMPSGWELTATPTSTTTTMSAMQTAAGGGGGGGGGGGCLSVTAATSSASASASSGASTTVEIIPSFFTSTGSVLWPLILLMSTTLFLTARSF